MSSILRATFCKSSARSTSRSEEHTSELQSLAYLVCRLLLENKTRRTQESPSHSQDRRCSPARGLLPCPDVRLMRTDPFVPSPPPALRSRPRRPSPQATPRNH